MDDELYAQPHIVSDPAECYFYHTVDLPTLGTQEGEWDLRGQTDVYLGGVDLSGKRVLEIGPANGFLTFEMESRGAEIVSIDLSPDVLWDMVPFASLDYSEVMTSNAEFLQRLNNGYWLGHAATNSEARVIYTAASDIPEAIGPVDTTVFGSVLLHMRDPFRALQQALRLTRETAVIVESYRPSRIEQALRLVGMGGRFEGSRAEARMSFLPDYRNEGNAAVWWYIPPALLREYLGVLGFEIETITYHAQPHNGKPSKLYTAVARRKRGNSLGDA